MSIFYNPITGKLENRPQSLADLNDGMYSGLYGSQGADPNMVNNDPYSLGADPMADYLRANPAFTGNPSTSYDAAGNPVNLSLGADPMLQPSIGTSQPYNPDYNPDLQAIQDAQISGVSNGSNRDPLYKRLLLGATGALSGNIGSLASKGLDYLLPGGSGGVPKVSTDGVPDPFQSAVNTGAFAPGGQYNPGTNPLTLGGGDYNPPDLPDLGPDPQLTLDSGNYPGGSNDLNAPVNLSGPQGPVTIEGSGPGGQPIPPSGTGSTPTPGGKMPYTYNPYQYTTAEPLQMFEQNRIGAAGVMNQNLADLTASANTNNANYNALKTQAYSGQGGYGNVLAGTAGYSSQELADMYQKDLMGGALATDQQLGQYDYTGAEKSAITGNPMAGYNAFQSGMGGVNSATSGAAALGLGALGTGADLYNSSYTNSANLGTGALANMKDLYGSAIDPTALGLSDEYKQNYNITPQDMQNIRDSAGRTVGLNAQSEIDRLQRAASAQGSTSPLALQSAMTRRAYTGDINAATAMTDADIKARQLGLTVAANRESMRLGSEEDISNRLMTSAQQQGSAGLNQAQYLGSQGYNAANQQATNALQNAQLTGSQGIDTAKYGTTGSAAYAQQGDTAASQRAADLAAAERAALTTQLGTNYSQKFGVGQFNSGVASANANMNQSLAAQGRTYLTTQEAAAKAAEEEALRQKQAATTQGQQSIDTATMGALKAKAVPSAADKILNIVWGAGSGAAGA